MVACVPTVPVGCAGSGLYYISETALASTGSMLVVVGRPGLDTATRTERVLPMTPCRFKEDVLRLHYKLRSATKRCNKVGTY
jgi:hypothetical protein